MSGANVKLGEVLSKYNRSEFHHIFPQKFLKDQGYGAREINRLANFAIISAADNKTLGGKAPSEYREKMNHSNLKSVLLAASTPASLFQDDYGVFLRERADMLEKVATGLTGEAT